MLLKYSTDIGEIRMIKKIGIIVCFLLIIPLFSLSAAGGPMLGIGEVNGGILYNTVEILNIGDIDAPEVNCWINQSGGIFGLSMNHQLTSFPLNSRGIKIEKHPIGFAFGSHKITITAYIPGEEPVFKTVNAFVFGIFVIILH